MCRNQYLVHLDKDRGAQDFPRYPWANSMLYSGEGFRGVRTKTCDFSFSSKERTNAFVLNTEILGSKNNLGFYEVLVNWFRC